MPSAPSISLRATTAADDAFLFALYASTRAEELAGTGWPAPQRDAFLRSQFAARRRHYQATYAHAEHSVIVARGEPIGAMIVHRSAAELRLVDLALLPPYRGTGLGTQILQRLLREADAARTPLRLHVLKANRATRLYARLGFAPAGDSGLYLKMEYIPA